MIKFYSINENDETHYWEYGSVEELIQEWYSDDPMVPASVDTVFEVLIDGKPYREADALCFKDLIDELLSGITMTFKELAVVWCGIAEVYKENRDGSNRPDHTIEKCVAKFGHDAVAETLATVVRLKPWDGRIWPSNREWAENIWVNPDAIVHNEKNGFLRGMFRVDGKLILVDVDAIHMSHVNQLVSEIRKCEEGKAND